MSGTDLEKTVLMKETICWWCKQWEKCEFAFKKETLDICIAVI